MGKGRKPLPNAIKRLKGTDQRCRMRNEPKAVAPMALTDVEKIKVVGLTNERQKEIFQVTCKRLAALNMMEDAYQDSIVMYAYWFDLALTAMSQITNKNMVATRYDENGRVAGFFTNPFILILEKATKQVNDIGRQFGFTALSRSNLHLAEKELNPVEELAKLMG